mgnify:CR=1 FL=1
MATNTPASKATPFMIRGIAAYPKLNAPYRYDQTLRKSVVDHENGSYSVDIIVDAAAAKTVKAAIEAAAKTGGVKAIKNPPWTAEEDATTGEPTGRVRFKAKGYAKRKDGTPNRISHFDANARPMPADTRLTSGSDVRVQVYPRVFTALGGGVRLEINAVQVLRLVAYEGHNPFGVDPEFAADGDDDDAAGAADEQQQQQQGKGDDATSLDF